MLYTSPVLWCQVTYILCFDVTWMSSQCSHIAQWCLAKLFQDSDWLSVDDLLVRTSDLLCIFIDPICDDIFIYCIAINRNYIIEQTFYSHR